MTGIFFLGSREAHAIWFIGAQLKCTLKPKSVVQIIIFDMVSKKKGDEIAIACFWLFRYRPSKFNSFPVTSLLNLPLFCRTVDTLYTWWGSGDYDNSNDTSVRPFINNANTRRRNASVDLCTVCSLLTCSSIFICFC